jgi:hypothetical protein
MLNNKKKIYFPKIVFIKPVEFTSKNSELENKSDKTAHSLYRLDWSKKTNKCNGGQPELHEYFEHILSEMVFAIDDGYLSEIRRAAWLSIYELNQKRDIDPAIKQIYLDPVISYVYESFRLLADCAFDESTQFYYRGDHKEILTYLLLYKFWKNQISKNLILKFCRIDELITKATNTDNIDSSKADQINFFLKYINNELEDMNG